MNTHRQVKVLTAAFFLVGVGLLAASVFLAWNTSAFIHTSRTALGRVVDLEWRGGAGGRRASGGGYVTVFAFADSSGQVHTVRTKAAQNPTTHQIGAEVEVFFQPACPDEAKIRSFQTLWLIPIDLAGFGISFAGIGGFAFVWQRRNT